MCGKWQKTQVEENPLSLLPVALKHIYAVGELEQHHGDPFDRRLIAQAKVEGLQIITKDPRFVAYDGVETIW